uniref:Major facilitator superfamily (MFS) profile domain-containing protein n=1 Tax=Alexandrium monilatum TaxID=311494 RepID=A0A7S4T7M0_9DINO
MQMKHVACLITWAVLFSASQGAILGNHEEVEFQQQCGKEAALAGDGMAEPQGQCGEEATQIMTSLLQSSLRIDPAGPEAGPGAGGASANAGAKDSSGPAADLSPEHGPGQTAAGPRPVGLAAAAASRSQRAWPVPWAFTAPNSAPPQPRRKWKEPEWFWTAGKYLVIVGFAILIGACASLALNGAHNLAGELQTSEGRAGINPWSTLYMVMLFTVWESISTDQYVPNINQMQVDLDASDEQISLSVLENSIVKGLAGLSIGALSDHIGRRRTILFFLGLMPISTLACGLAPNGQWFLAARFLQGVAEGGSVVVGGVIRDIFPGAEERGKAFATFSMVVMVVPLISPSIGGLLGTWIGWRAVFMLLAPGMLLSWLQMYFFLPETLIVNPDIRTSYWREVGRLLGDYQLMSLVVAIAAVYAPGSLMGSNLPLILQDLMGITPMQMALFLAVGSVLFCVGIAMSGTCGAKWGMLSLLRFGSAILLLPAALFIVCGTLLSHSVWALLTAQLLYQLVVGPFCMAADVLYMQPLAEVYALAEALKTLICVGLSPLLVSLPGTVLVANGHSAVRSYTLFSSFCIVASLAIAWVGFIWSPPDWAMRGQRQFEESLEAMPEIGKPMPRRIGGSEVSARRSSASGAVKPAAVLLEKKK